MGNKSLLDDKLGFVKDGNVKKIIEDSIQYINIIFEEAEKRESALYKEETYRVIVLYVISIIEAILLYIFNLHKGEISYIEYKGVSSLSQKYNHLDFADEPVVIAVQKSVTKEHIMIADLVTFMKNNGFMNLDIAQEILEINNIRNTFHFTKPRNKITCEIETVEKAFGLLVKIIDGGPKAVIFKK